ncbi:MAG: conserved phage C-terminal domain-containing protein [Chloroflexi bacterium]|nr:conserved phage C-terminal domain-containing protein [Chloroflexota bacterium]
MIAACNEITGRSLSLTPARRRKIVARLKEGFTPEQLVDAMRGAHGDPYYRGEDPKTNGRRYDQPETVFRDAGCVERHLEHLLRLRDGKAVPMPLSKSTRRQYDNLRVLQDWGREGSA